MNTFVSHPSVRVKGTENNYEPAPCTDPKCHKSWLHMHCPFCVKNDTYQDPVILKAHYRVKHVDKGIEFAGLKILRCCEHCDIVGTIKGAKDFKGPHWHCYRCRNGFNRRDEALKHYRTHFRNPHTTFQIQIAQDVSQVLSMQSEVSEALDCIPHEMHALTETVVMTQAAGGFLGVSPESPENGSETEEAGKAGDGELQVSVAANETVGTSGDQSQTIMIIQEDQGGDKSAWLATLQDKARFTAKVDLDVASDVGAAQWHQEREELQQRVVELCAEKGQLEADRALHEAQLQAEIEQLKLQIEVHVNELSQSRQRERELLHQLSVPLDGSTSRLLLLLKAQHEELLHQQLAALRQAYLGGPQPAPPDTTDPAPQPLPSQAMDSHDQRADSGGGLGGDDQRADSGGGLGGDGPQRGRSHAGVTMASPLIGVEQEGNSSLYVLTEPSALQEVKTDTLLTLSKAHHGPSLTSVLLAASDMALRAQCNPGGQVQPGGGGQGQGQPGGGGQGQPGVRGQAQPGGGAPGLGLAGSGTEGPPQPPAHDIEQETVTVIVEEGGGDVEADHSVQRHVESHVEGHVEGHVEANSRRKRKLVVTLLGEEPEGKISRDS